MTYTFKHGDRPLDGYTIQRGVGRGGFGEVYYAVSDGGKEVALKYLRDNPAVELRGVSHCLNLKDPRLVTIFDVRKNDRDEHFIVMEYIAGPSLRDLLIAEPDGLGLQKAAYFLREIGRGLSFLHERGIVHRDLKPGNIFFEDGRVKIGDYGLAKFISTSKHSVQTASVGTVHYMAPEIATGSYSQSVDVYALGVILYEMLLGRVPFDGATMGEVLMKHLMTQPEVEALPTPFPDVIRMALAKDPKERFQSVEEMVQAVFGEPSIEASVAGFDAASLRNVAAAIDLKGVREAHETLRPAVASGDRPIPTTPQAASEAPAAIDRRGWRPSIGSIILGLITLAACYLFVSRGHPWLGFGVLMIGWGYLYDKEQRSAKSAATFTVTTGGAAQGLIEIPLRRSFVAGKRNDLGEVLTRYLVSLGYARADVDDYSDGLLWAFKDEETETVTVRIAAYEIPDGYHLTCTAYADDPDDLSHDARKSIARDVDGLDALLRSLGDSRTGTTVAEAARVG